MQWHLFSCFLLRIIRAVTLSHTGSRFLFTENVQFSYVSLRCSSSGQRTRSRHGRKAAEEDSSSITAEFELDVNLEEVTGWSLCASCLPVTFAFYSLLSVFRCSLSVTKQTKPLKYLLF